MQRAILLALCEHVDRFGYPPSVRELGNAVDLKSTSTVAHHLRTLEEKGYLRRYYDKPRAITILRRVQ
jgi:repressor LexA